MMYVCGLQEAYIFVMCENDRTILHINHNLEKCSIQFMFGQNAKIHIIVALFSIHSSLTFHSWNLSNIQKFKDFYAQKSTRVKKSST